MLVLQYGHTILTLFPSRGGICVPSPGLWLSQQRKLCYENPPTLDWKRSFIFYLFARTLAVGITSPHARQAVPLPRGCHAAGPLVDSSSWDSSLSLPRQKSNMGRKKHPFYLVPQGSESPSPPRAAALPCGDLQTSGAVSRPNSWSTAPRSITHQLLLYAPRFWRDWLHSSR